MPSGAPGQNQAVLADLEMIWDFPGHFGLMCRKDGIATHLIPSIPGTLQATPCCPKRAVRNPERSILLESRI
jgi:hypothetical protein